eukprot:tig00020902_g15059.t1
MRTADSLLADLLVLLFRHLGRRKPDGTAQQMNGPRIKPRESLAYNLAERLGDEDPAFKAFLADRFPRPVLSAAMLEEIRFGAGLSGESLEMIRLGFKDLAEGFDVPSREEIREYRSEETAKLPDIEEFKLAHAGDDGDTGEGVCVNVVSGKAPRGCKQVRRGTQG